MATILSCRLFSIPGRTFSTPILAVLITPQRTGSIAHSLDAALLFSAPRLLGGALARQGCGTDSEQ
jgi:hypothetical protein